jgi:glycerate 2-kinase
VDAVDPARLVHAALARTDPGGLPRSVVAAGKAAWGMFAAAVTVIPARAAVIATPVQDRGVEAQGVEVFDAGHPAPNRASVAAGERALRLGRASAPEGGLLVLLSGGASAMLAAPASGVALEDKIETGRALMSAGAAIHELNCVRKHLSRVKGGRLAAAAGRSITLALSDVHGPVPDDPSVIGSGPTVPDETTFDEAIAVIRNRGIAAPASVIAHLECGARGEAEETIKPGDHRIAESVYTVIGNRQTAVEGAKRAAEARGYRVITIAAATVGEARDAARSFVKEACRLLEAVPRPLCVIASGETTVTVRGEGKGGRNQEFALAAASELHLLGTTAVLGSAGTDGVDGPTEAAGAIVDTTTLDRAAHTGVDPAAAFATNDTYHFFEPLGDLLVWGPTGTNVGDLHVLLVG